MSCPKVSVIIPAYNTEAYIERAIESALSQTLEDIEIIFVDDASVDLTVAKVAKFSDPRLKLLVNEGNLGAGATRNRALKVATGKWIAVLDSDDWYTPERLEKLVKIAQEQDADLVVDNLYLIEDGASTPWSTLVDESGEQIDEIMQIDAAYFVNSDIEGRRGLHLGFSKPLFRREFLSHHQLEYSPSIKVSQDFWLNMECFRHGARFFFVPQAYYFYCARNGSLSLSSNRVDRLDQECEAIANFMEYQDFLAHHPQLVTALSLKMRETKTLRNYYFAIEAIEKRKFWTAWLCFVLNPICIWYSLRRLPGAIERKFKTKLNRNSSVRQTRFSGL
jgi:succinoglycan biosynthesis protein ExoO